MSAFDDSAFDHAASIRPQHLSEGITSRPVHGEKMTLSLIELAPEAELPEHRHLNEQIGILIQGSLSFTIAEEAAELLPGATWRILADTPHSVRAGAEGAVIAEAFSPPRAEWKALTQHEPGPGRWP